MTVRQMIRIVVLFGLATLAIQALGLDTLGGLMALVHLCGLVGAPLAMLLDRQVRSPSVVVVLSIVLSIAVSALAVQSLIWFVAADRLLLIAVATGYGAGVAALLASDHDPAVRS